MSNDGMLLSTFIFNNIPNPSLLHTMPIDQNGNLMSAFSNRPRVILSYDLCVLYLLGLFLIKYPKRCQRNSNIYIVNNTT